MSRRERERKERKKKQKDKLKRNGIEREIYNARANQSFQVIGVPWKITCILGGSPQTNLY